jgi:hypothetical protein
VWEQILETLSNKLNNPASTDEERIAIGHRYNAALHESYALRFMLELIDKKDREENQGAATHQVENGSKGQSKKSWNPSIPATHLSLCEQNWTEVGPQSGYSVRYGQTFTTIEQFSPKDIERKDIERRKGWWRRHSSEVLRRDRDRICCGRVAAPATRPRKRPRAEGAEPGTKASNPLIGHYPILG